MVVVKTYIILYNSHISHTIQVATTLLVASKCKRAGRGIYLEIFSWLQLYHSTEYNAAKLCVCMKTQFVMMLMTCACLITLFIQMSHFP